jgi:hypothetical protein
MKQDGESWNFSGPVHSSFLTLRNLFAGTVQQCLCANCDVVATLKE